MTPTHLSEMVRRRALVTGAGSGIGLAHPALQVLAHTVRSKNAGPTQLTVDVLFHDAPGYALAARSRALSVDNVAALYQLDPSQVQRFLLPDILAIKFSMPRRICAGNPGDGDVYGAQQHAPLLELAL